MMFPPRSTLLPVASFWRSRLADFDRAHPLIQLHQERLDAFEGFDQVERLA
jgi:hypothetical protein